MKTGRRGNERGVKRIVISGAALLLILVIAGAIWGLPKQAEEKTEKSGEQKKKRIVVENKMENKTDQTPEEKTADTRRVKNTATEEKHKTNGLAICMYHYVYEKENPPKDLNNNYIEVRALEEEVKYLVENDYYFPTWEEVRQYVEGNLLLPEKSVVLTFDDGAKSFLKLGIPVFEKYKVPATSFLITSKDGEAKVKEYKNDYVVFQSHSHNMHRGGGNIGHGGIFTAMGHEDAVADLKKSIEICGNGDALAYPYGDYTEDCKKAVSDAGFSCAVTTENRRAKVGDDPLLLPRVRMLLGQSLDSFINLVK